MVVRGQVSVEFFLVLSLLFALAAVLLTTAEAQLRDAESLNNAALSKAALDAVGSYVDLVYLSGNGSIVSGQVFIPASSLCFIVNASTETLQCDPDPSLTGRVNSRPLKNSVVFFNSSCPPYSASTGWFDLTVYHNGSSVLVNCTRVT